MYKRTLSALCFANLLFTGAHEVLARDVRDADPRVLRRTKHQKTRMFVSSVKEYTRQLDMQAEQYSADAQVMRRMIKDLSREGFEAGPEKDLLDALTARAQVLERRAQVDEQTAALLRKSMQKVLQKNHPKAAAISRRAKNISRKMLDVGLDPQDLEDVLTFLSSGTQARQKAVEPEQLRREPARLVDFKGQERE